VAPANGGRRRTGGANRVRSWAFLRARNDGNEGETRRVGLGRDGQVEALHARHGAWAHGRAARGPARRIPVRGRGIRRGQDDGGPHGVRRSTAETPKSVRQERWGGRVAQGLSRARRCAATSALRLFFIPFSLLRNCITPKSSN
jgi:hypothetical protein